MLPIVRYLIRVLRVAALFKGILPYHLPEGLPEDVLAEAIMVNLNIMIEGRE